MKIKVEFEVADDVELFGTGNIEGSLHEALCLALHEGEPEAQEWLKSNVQDIQLEYPVTGYKTLDIYQEIVTYGQLDDRREYTEEDLKGAYDLTDDQAKNLKSLIMANFASQA